LISGTRGIIFLNYSHNLRFKARLGQGTNNFIELMALKLTLSLDAKKYFTNIKIFRDSFLVVKWLKREHEMRNFILQPLFDDIKGIILFFNSIYFQHIFKERNYIAYGFSKVGIQLACGEWIIKE
jgi:ribonuclease HI